MNKRSVYSKISIALILCILVSLFNPIEIVRAATWTEPSTNIVWTYVASGQNATKVYTNTAGLSGTITVPSTINNLTVTSVGYGTTSYKLINNATSRENVTEVILPDTVTDILAYTFSDHTALKRITIPENVTTLGGYAFRNCTSLNELIINARHVQTYPSSSQPPLNGVSELKEITIEEKTENINLAYLLRGYSNIEKINFNALNYSDATLSLSNLSSVRILNIGENVGKYSANIYGNLNGLTEINYNAINANMISPNSYSLPSNVKVYIGENVINLPANSFSSNNTTYYMLNRNTTLEDNAITNPWSGTMYGWYNTPAHTYAVENGLTFIDYDSYGTVTENGIEWYYEKGEDDTLAIKPTLGGSSLSGDIIVPETLNGKVVTKISNNAFENANITGITLPNTITALGDSAFAGSSLANIELPSSLITIGNGAFAYMNNIEEITIPEGVVILNENTFNSSSIKRINLPSSVISIGENSFYNLSNLENITVAEGNSAYKSIDGILYNKDVTQLLLYPINSQTTSYSIPNTITNLYSNSLNGYTPLVQGNNLTKLIIPENVTNIGKDYYGVIELYNNPNDVVITILNKNIAISDYSIAGNSITIASFSPSNAKTYAENSYINFEEYKETTYPYWIKHSVNGVINEALTESGEAPEGAIISDFIDNSDDANVIINMMNFPLVVSSNAENNTAIIEYESTGFAWKAVQEQQNGGELGWYAYPSNVNLAEGDIIVPSIIDGKEIIGVGGFKGNTKITSLTIPEGVKFVQNEAFKDCINLKTINFPSTISALGNLAFQGNTSLNRINFPSTGTINVYVGYGVFWRTAFVDFIIDENVDFYPQAIGIQLVSGPYLESIRSYNENASFAYHDTLPFITGVDMQALYGGAPNFNTVYGYTKSTADKYVKENEDKVRTFIALDEAPIYPVITRYYFDDILDENKTEVFEDVEGTVISEFTDYSSSIYELSHTVNNPLIISSNPYDNIREIYYITTEDTTNPENPDDGEEDPDDGEKDPDDGEENPTPENPDPNDGDNNENPDPDPEPTPTPTPEPTPTPNPDPNPGDGNGDETVIIGDIDNTKILISYTPIIYSEFVNGKLIFSDLSFVNNGVSYVKISISGIENNTSMQNVLPNHFGDISEWDRLGKKKSRELIAPSLHPLNNNYSTIYTTGDIPFKYIEESVNDIDLGILPPGGSATYSLIVHHGKSFEEGVMVGWNLKWKFDFDE